MQDIQKHLTTPEQKWTFGGNHNIQNVTCFANYLSFNQTVKSKKSNAMSSSANTYK